MTIEELEKLCAEATPGPWWSEALSVENSHAIIADCKAQLADIFDDNQVQATADFIATFNPVLVRKLIAVAKAAKSLLDIEGNGTVLPTSVLLQAAILRDELAALEEAGK